MSERDPRLKRFGLSGYNKPKKTPNHPTKSHVVLAKKEGVIFIPAHLAEKVVITSEECV